ncbi:DUF4328 domain-containing protein [Streptomyces turgidiscabies]|uniref:DUF4328 domain-containing protein n=1 Tax=Streptomyces turgidiscabies TaxID=85558 RepID=UPI0038F70A0B
MITPPQRPPRPRTPPRQAQQMTSVTSRTPWVLARSAQAATGVAALADVFRAVAVRDLHLRDTGATDHKSAFASMVFLYAMTLAIVLFLVWLARSRRNAQQLSPLASVPSPGWTMGAWFIPVVNLFVPRRLVLDIGRASSGSWEQRRSTTGLMGCPGRDGRRELGHLGRTRLHRSRDRARALRRPSDLAHEVATGDTTASIRISTMAGGSPVHRGPTAHRLAQRFRTHRLDHPRLGLRLNH